MNGSRKFSNLGGMAYRFQYMLEFTICVLMFMACTQTAGKRLKDDADVKEYFTPTQIEGLQHVVDHFDSLMLASTEAKSAPEAYQQFFARLDPAEDLEPLYSMVAWKESAATRKEVLEMVKYDVFGEVYKVEEVYKIVSNETSQPDTFYELNLKRNTAFINLLKSKQERYPVLENYTTGLNQMADISPSMIALLLKAGYKEVDFKDPVIRLFWAVHYIALLSSAEKGYYQDLPSDKKLLKHNTNHAILTFSVRFTWLIVD